MTTAESSRSVSPSADDGAPDLPTLTDLDDLLVGLGSDDLNDFDDIDDFGDALDEMDDKNVTISSSEDPHTAGGVEDADPFLLPAPSAGPTGFATAAGRMLPPVSQAAIAKARKIVGIDNDEEPAIQEDSPNKRRRLDGPSGFSFSTAAGKTLPPPSRAALAKVANIFNEVNMDEDSSSQAPTAGPSGTSSSFAPVRLDHMEPPFRAPAFATASGKLAPPPSKRASEVAFSLFNDLQTELASATPVNRTSTNDVNTTIPPPLVSSRDQVLAMFEETDAVSASPGLPVKSAFASSSFGTPKPFHPPGSTSNAVTSTRPSSQLGSRTPLSTTTNIFSTNTGIQRSSQLKPIDIKTPRPVRRLGVGGTPSSAKGTGRKPFATPFKAPTAAHNLTPITKTGSSQSTPLRTSAINFPVVHGEVFDLTIPSGRQTWKKAFLKPQYNTPGELCEMGLPDEIWSLDLTNAIDYQFISQNAVTLGRSNALNVLRGAGCLLATAKWVDNHYPLMLWKLAGEVQAQPSLFDKKWNWGEVIDQLKYRYEREFGAAQRPIVRRIQEHDSSAAVPMVLCVSAIRRPEATEDEQGKILPVKPYLELTDGWYRIKAEVDECLVRAIDKGKITVGRKLAVTGAKLDSATDGEDALDALDKSRLVISANSCSLARWDAKLGRRPVPFVAGLSHLSVDGGVIALMDVVVEKIFPLAFVHVEKGVKESPWGEAEENSRADQYRDRYESELRKLNEEAQSRYGVMQDLAQTLASAAQEAEGRPDTPPESLDQDFDMLLRANDQSRAMRSFPDSHLVHLAAYARHRLDREMEESRAEIEATLRVTVPPRQIRDFRIIRLVDAQEGRKEPARVGMLTVWDARSLGEGSLQEGKRYMVSNLMPARTGDWSVPRGPGRREVYLNTRRETRWKAIDLRGCSGT